PFLIAATLLTAIVYLFSASGGGDRRTLDVPNLNRIAAVEGVETEVALSPDGARCAVISDGDLWVLNFSDGIHLRLTETPENEYFPAWSSDGRRLTFSRGTDTFVMEAGPTVSAARLFKSGATYLSWASSGRLTYVRGRGL